MTNKYPVNAQKVPAVYSQLRQILYQGNPLIEALPVIQEPAQVYKKLMLEIPYTEEEREYSTQDRLDCISVLAQCFQPLGIHISLADRFMRSIKDGYIQRNPMNIVHKKENQQLYGCVVNRDSNFQGYLSNASATGFAVIGYSGMGKTSVINRVLSLYPQMIIHDKYKNTPFSHIQFVWMKLECPYDGSVKGFCLNFFQEFDHITGDNTYHKFAKSRVTTDQMIPEIALLAHRHSLGVLVIDEIQRISLAKSGGMDKMLNFITHLVNKIGIPVVFAGTPGTIEVLSSNFANARRSLGQLGAIIMDVLRLGSPNWQSFVKGIWKYQWTAVKTPLSEELSDSLCDKSGGIIALAVSLYMKAQFLAIQRGKDEKITPKLISDIANSDDYRVCREQVESIKRPNDTILKSPDGALLRWKLYGQEYDLKELFPIANRVPKPDEPRNEELQQEVSIPKQDKKKVKRAIPLGSIDAENLEQKLMSQGKVVRPEDEF